MTQKGREGDDGLFAVGKQKAHRGVCFQPYIRMTNRGLKQMQHNGPSHLARWRERRDAAENVKMA